MSNNTPSPAPGWYPAPHANNEQRYWDGVRWTDWTPESAAAANAAQTTPQNVRPAPAQEPATAATVTMTAPQPGAEGVAGAPAPRKGLPWWGWALIGVGALVALIIVISVVIGTIVGAATVGAGGVAAPTSAASEEPAVVDEADEPVDTRVDTPDVVGLTVAEARAAIEGAGLVFAVVDGTGDDWVVATQTISVPAEPGTEVFVTATEPEPVLTLAQENAVGSALNYLDFTSFSRQGLIGQLEYEGFSTEDATFAVDFIAPDWNEQAALKAQEYLDFTSFSRQGLYDQLAYEGFTDEQINYALGQVGY